MRIKPLAVLAAVAALGVPATAASAKPKTEKQHAAKHEKAAKAKNAVFKGTVVSADGTTVTVHVDKANKWGRSFKGQDVAFDVSGVKKAPVVAAGDAVVVQARLKAGDAAPLAARKLNKADDDEDDEAEAPEAPEQD